MSQTYDPEVLSSLRAGQFYDALRIARIKIAKQPNARCQYVLLAVALIGSGDHSSAEAWLWRMLTAGNLSNFETNYYLGLIQLRRGVFNEAERYFASAMVHEPRSAKAFLSRVACLLELRREPLVLWLCDQRVEFAAEDPHVHAGRAEALYRIRFNSRAILAAKRATILSPGVTNHMATLGRVALAGARHALAKRQISRIYLVDGETQTYHDMAGILSDRTGDLKNARHQLLASKSGYVRNYRSSPSELKPWLVQAKAFPLRPVKVFRRSLEKRSKYVVMASGDRRYLGLYGSRYIGQFTKCAPHDATLHLHCLDVERKDLNTLVRMIVGNGVRNFMVTYEDTTALASRDRKSFYACARLIRLPEFLRHHGAPVLLTDIDIVLQTGLSKWVRRNRDARFSILHRDPSINPSVDLVCAVMMAHPNGANFRFLWLVRRFLVNVFARPGQSFWLLDQLSLHCINRYLEALTGRSAVGRISTYPKPRPSIPILLESHHLGSRRKGLKA